MENWCMPRTNYTILTSPTLWSKKVYEILNKCKLNQLTDPKSNPGLIVLKSRLGLAIIILN